MSFTQGHNTALVSEPRQNFQVLDTTDLGAARAELTRRYTPHDLRCDARSSSFRFLHVFSPIKNGYANLLHYGSEVEIEPETFGDFYMLEMPLEGGVDLETDRNEMRSSDTNSALFIPPDARFRSRWRQSTRQFMIQFNAADVQSRWREMVQNETDYLPSVMPVIQFESDEGWRVKQSLMLLREEFERGLRSQRGSIARSPFSAAVLDSVLDYIRVRHEKELRPAELVALPGSLKRVVDYVRDNLTDDITVSDLVAVSGTGERNLFNHFATFLDTTPKRYIQRKRLQHARKLLLAGNVSVQAAALQSGFRHMGRFSQIYASHFSEKPSETLSKH